MRDGLLEAARILYLIRDAEIAGREGRTVPLTVADGTSSAAKVHILEIAASIIRDRADTCAPKTDASKSEEMFHRDVRNVILSDIGSR